MRRLCEIDLGDDIETARDAALIAAIDPLPLAESVQRKRRVRAALVSRRRAPRRWLRVPALASVLLISVAALAAAAVARRWLPSPLREPPAPKRAAPATAPIGARPRATEPAPAPSLVLTPPPSPSVPALAPPISPPTLRRKRVEIPAALEPASPAIREVVAPPRVDPALSVRDRAPGTLEGTVVIDAVNALRRDGEPERASMLLTYYIDRFPDGPVAEEAMALAVEAAAARDKARAARLAARYLDRYPTGRFRKLIERARTP